MQKKPLTIFDFKLHGDTESAGHYFRHRLNNGGEICMEACVGGYCVGKYNEHKMLLGEKICTNDNGKDDFLSKAIEIANTMV